jgi:magnesium transporter
MHGKSENVTWIDLQNPTKEDLAAIQAKYGFHDVIMKELEVPSLRTHIELYDNYLFFVYNFPLYNALEQTSRRAEIDFLITGDTVVTVHYEPLEPVSELQNFKAGTPFDLLYAVLQKIFQFEERQLRHIREKLEDIGENLFRNKEKQILRAVSFLKRDISEYRVIVRSSESVLKSLNDRGVAIWGEGARVYLNDLEGDHYKIVSQIEDYREALNDFELTNSYLMSSKTNDVMKRFTAMSFLTFPFVLFVAIFSMNAEGNPFLHIHNAFWIAFGAVILGILALASYFNAKDWL